MDNKTYEKVLLLRNERKLLNLTHFRRRGHFEVDWILAYISIIMWTKIYANYIFLFKKKKKKKKFILFSYLIRLDLS